LLWVPSPHWANYESNYHQLLSQTLSKVSATDPNSLTLPSDPFESLTRLYGLNELETYDQRWTTDIESVNYVKRMVVVSGETKTERCWSEESECGSHARFSKTSLKRT
jgi:hypothetical protein